MTKTSRQPQISPVLVAFFLLISIMMACNETPTQTAEYEVMSADSPERSVRLALWLAKKEELIAHEDAYYDLVMTGWIDPSEEAKLRARYPSTKLLAGLTHTWIFNDPGWLDLLVIVANNGDTAGPLQINNDMYMMFDDDGDGIQDRNCTPPGWDQIYAMDPRHPGWRDLITAFYKNLAGQPQHDGVIIDMVDAYPFCDGAWSRGVPTPIDPTTWISAQAELLELIQEEVPSDKWIIANAGRDYPDGSSFPAYLNGYVLENFLGEWGLNLADGLASAQRALETTKAPHAVIFSVDTDDTGVISWPRFRTGLAASLLLDHTYFAFDFGPRDHGGVVGWWFPEFYQVDLGKPLGSFSFQNFLYRRDFEKGIILIATDQPAQVSFETPHRDIFTGESGTEFTVYQDDARILIPGEGE